MYSWCDLSVRVDWLKFCIQQRCISIDGDTTAHKAIFCCYSCLFGMRIRLKKGKTDPVYFQGTDEQIISYTNHGFIGDALTWYWGPKISVNEINWIFGSQKVWRQGILTLLPTRMRNSPTRDSKQNARQVFRSNRSQNLTMGWWAYDVV